MLRGGVWSAIPEPIYTDEILQTSSSPTTYKRVRLKPTNSVAPPYPPPTPQLRIESISTERKARGKVFFSLHVPEAQLPQDLRPPAESDVIRWRKEKYYSSIRWRPLAHRFRRLCFVLSMQTCLSRRLKPPPSVCV